MRTQPHATLHTTIFFYNDIFWEVCALHSIWLACSKQFSFQIVKLLHKLLLNNLKKEEKKKKNDPEKTTTKKGTEAEQLSSI